MDIAPAVILGGETIDIYELDGERIFAYSAKNSTESGSTEIARQDQFNSPEAGS
jgi:hypothetical protein